jgi:hypothetical protein
LQLNSRPFDIRIHGVLGGEDNNFPRPGARGLSQTQVPKPVLAPGNLDDMAWSSLLSAPLRHFALADSLSHPVSIRALSACGTFRDLETLVVPNLSKPRDSRSHHPGVFEFIARHSHVRKLSVSSGEAGVVDSHLIPLLTNGTWSNLTSLSLSWNDWNIQHVKDTTVTVPAASLAAIGSIASLEQLRLSGGSSIGWRRQWLVDHDMMRSSLRGLERLKRLALVRDAYVNPGNPVAVNAPHLLPAASPDANRLG